MPSRSPYTDREVWEHAVLTTRSMLASRALGDTAGAPNTAAEAAGMAGAPTTAAIPGPPAAAAAMAGMGAGAPSWAARLTRNSAVRLHHTLAHDGPPHICHVRHFHVNCF